MAGEWIKMRTNLWDDPRVTRLADETDQPEAMIIGGLYWLWSTADEHSSDGLLADLTLRAIDRKTGIKGFGAALVLVGWLTESDEGVTVTRFEEHNGASAKQRAQTAKRVANHKANAKVTDQALPEAGDAVTGALAKEDKNKKEDQKPPIPPEGGSVRQRSKSETVTLQTFLENCKAKGERPLRDYAPLWHYAEQAGLPNDFVALAWVEFCRRFLPEGTAKAKRYTDWRRAFRKYVEGDYLKLWAIDANGTYFLTTQGKQAQKVHRDKEAA